MCNLIDSLLRDFYIIVISLCGIAKKKHSIRLQKFNGSNLIFYCFSYFFLVCRALLDLVFVVDGSGSIEAYGKGNFRRCLNFVRTIVSQFRINNGQTRIGVVLFSSRPRLIFDLRRYRRKSQVLNAISRIRYPRGGTKTGYAMRYSYSRVFRYARRGARKVNRLLFEFLT